MSGVIEIDRESTFTTSTRSAGFSTDSWYLAGDEASDDESEASVQPTEYTSIHASIMEFQVENGRTYHAMSAGKYPYPNDELEAQRYELQHNIWLLQHKGQLVTCPYAQDNSPRRVLDCGTGTGIWAIDYADQHPDAQVIGVDLSPIQPSLLPPNCSFIVDDLEKEWHYSEPFDFIFARALTGSLASWPAFLKAAYENLEPGGWLELQDIDLTYVSDDYTLLPNSPLSRLNTNCASASDILARTLTPVNNLRTWMREAGFINLVEKKDKWPMNPWPRDKGYKELGAWNLANMDAGLEALSMGLLTRVHGWTSKEVSDTCRLAKTVLADTNIHAYLRVGVVYGQKPINAE